MKNLPETVKKALIELKSGLTKLYGDRLVCLALYGSFARGDFSEESDVDVAVILRGEVIIGEEVERISPLVSETSLRY